MRERELDLTDEGSSPLPSPDSNAGKGGRRPFLGVLFSCCGVYSRVFPNFRHTAYVGHCPRCGGRAEIRIEPGGSNERFFVAS